MRVKLLRVELAVHAHATEDEEAVKRALLNLLPPELRGRARLRTQRLRGHYLNPITRMTLSIEGRGAEEVLRWIAGIMDEGEKELLWMELDQRYDESTGRLYLRFSKQDAYMGRARLGAGDDVVRAVIVFQGAPAREEVVEKLRELGVLH